MYTTSTLEDWIHTRFTSLNITTPQDIDIKYLAYHHNIFINYKPMPSRYDVYGRYRGIVLDDQPWKNNGNNSFMNFVTFLDMLATKP